MCYVCRYPADEQYCFIKFESFGHSIGQFRLKWKDMALSTINPDINLAQFTFSVDLISKDSVYSDEDNLYPSLVMKITLTREANQENVYKTY